MIKWKGYEVGRGSDKVARFVSDMHILTFRADAVVNTLTDLRDQVDRFAEDQEAFDYTDYDCGAKFHKANRDY